MTKHILIVGDDADPHIKAVRRYLDENSARTLLLNPYNGTAGSIAYFFDPFRISFKDNAAAKHVEQPQIRSVWWRVKPHLTKYPKTIGEFETSNFIGREWQLSLEPLSYFLEDCFWMNKRSADQLLRNKPYQLYLAAIHGFKIPDGVISNDYASILSVTDAFEEIIYKPLGYFVSPPDKILFSNKISEDQLQTSRENISQAPCIFQKYIEKDYELRITVVGDKIFAAKIHSQESKLSKSDWRRDQFNLRYEITALDPAFEAKLLNFHQATGLVYGAYDFIVDPEGDHIFLEVNPVGQWLWLENQLPDLEISKQIATLLQG